MARIATDVCVIGAGSGGLSVAAGAARLGASVVLIEGHLMGGDCLNHGCVPSKALLAAAKQARAMQTGGPFGIAPVTPEISFAGAMEHVRAVIGTIAPHDSQERFEGLGVRVIRAWGRFVSPTEVEAGDTVISARRFVIATGSSPLIPPIPGLESVPYLTNESLFDLRQRPDHLLVIGAGPIGLEMAQAFRRLGSRVTVIEARKALGGEDPELAAVVLEGLRSEGIGIVEEAPAEEVAGSAGAIRIRAGGGHVFEGSHLLIAAGRRPNLARLDLDAGGIAHDDRGVTVDAGLRSVSNRRVHAVGDAAGGLQFTHVAGYHAGVVIRSMLFGLPAKAGTAHIPRATYTDPELAQVGLTEAEARQRHGSRLTVARWDYRANDRAVTEGLTSGFVKVMVVGGRPVGASIVGARAGELVAPWAMAVANRLKMSALARTVLPYPTLMEINRQAAGAYFSPRLFDNPWVRRAVRLVQRFGR